MQYQVVMTGVVAGGAREEVGARLAGLFGIEHEKALVLLGGDETVVKRGVDAETAERYRQAIADTGAGCRAEPVTSAEPAMPPPAPAPAVDPYRPPSASLLLEPEASDGAHSPRRVGAGRGLAWLLDGARLVLRAPLTWVGMLVIWFVASGLTMLVPIVGWLAASLLYPVIAAGFMIGADTQHQGGRIRIRHLFAGFGGNLGGLIGIGAVYLGGSLLLAGVGVLLMLALGANVAMLSNLAAEDPGTIDPAVMATVQGSVGIMVLAVLALFVPLLMAIWFAPALVGLHRIPLGQALSWSLSGCAKNWLPFLLAGIAILVLLLVVFGLVGVVAGLLLGPALVVVPIFLVSLLLMPIALASIYTGYRDIYLD